MHCWQVLRNTRKWEDWLESKVDECIPEAEGAEGDGGDEADSGRPANDYASDGDAAFATATAGDVVGGAARATAILNDDDYKIPRLIGRDAAKKRRSNGAPPSAFSSCLELFEKMAKNREIKQQQVLYVQERQLALQEEQTKIQREQWDWTKLKEENQIMLMNLDSCSSPARQYFMSLQKEILEKRLCRGGPGGTN